MNEELHHLKNARNILSIMCDQEKEAIGCNEYGFISDKWKDLNQVLCVIDYHLDWLGLGGKKGLLFLEE
jgi:hypothetical protein